MANSHSFFGTTIEETQRDIDPLSGLEKDSLRDSSDSPGFKRKDSANLEEGLKICIQGQFFVPNKTGRGTRSIFKCTPSKNAFFSKKKL